LDLRGIRIAVLGGDQREAILISKLTELGAEVRASGLPREMLPEKVAAVSSAEEAVENVQAVILPLPGTGPDGLVYSAFSSHPLYFTEEAAKKLHPKTLVIIGKARPFLREWSRQHQFTLLEIADVDELAILNSVPSAEGAIQIAMQETPITIHSSQSWVLGFGRLGKTLARMLKALGAHTTVCARKPADLARIWEMGCRGLPFSELTKEIGTAEIIFNTVPALVLTEEVLQRCQREALIVDLASAPGGTDFAAAKRLGIKAVLAPGLPGKVAPKTAGKILAAVVPSLIYEHLQQPKEKPAPIEKVQEYEKP